MRFDMLKGDYAKSKRSVMNMASAELGSLLEMRREGGVPVWRDESEVAM
jgi:hypothetical protein